MIGMCMSKYGIKASLALNFEGIKIAHHQLTFVVVSKRNFIAGSILVYVLMSLYLHAKNEDSSLSPHYQRQHNMLPSGIARL